MTRARGAARGRSGWGGGRAQRKSESGTRFWLGLCSAHGVEAALWRARERDGAGAGVGALTRALERRAR
jgi:hypothetical protein